MPARSPSRSAARLPDPLGFAAAVLLLIVVVLRAVVLFVQRLHWDTLPTPDDPPIVVFGPTGAAVTNLLLLIALTLAVAAAWRGGRRVHLALLGLWAVGSAFALYHAGAVFGSTRLAGDWIAGLAAGLAALHLAAAAPWRRLLIAGLIALAIPIGLRAVHQVTLGHAQTVEHYEQTRDQFLERRGWEPGSPHHRAYERRLYQREASGAFGLANVFGSVMLTLALLGGGAGLAAAGFPRPPRQPPPSPSPPPTPTTDPAAAGRMELGVVLGLAVLLALAGVALSGSKGVIGAFLIAGGAIAAIAWGARRGGALGRRPAVWAAAVLALPALVIALVLFRCLVLGVPDTAEGERSLLFRGMYWQAAVRMIADEPTLGVGPGRFKTEYLTHKNPLSPEDVADPHNVLLAWTATLGLGGWAWAALLLALAAFAGRHAARALNRTADQGPPPADRSPVVDDQAGSIRLAAGLAGALAFGAQFLLQLPVMTLTALMVIWLFGAVLWVWLTARLAVTDLLDRWPARIGLLAAAAAALMHNQISLGLTDTMAMPLLLTAIGLAAAPRKCDDHEKRPAVAIPLAALPLVFAVTVAVAVRAAAPIVVHETRMAQAAAAYRAGPTQYPEAARLLLRTGRAHHDPDAVRQGVRIAYPLLGTPHSPVADLDALLDHLAHARRWGADLVALWSVEARLAADRYAANGAPRWRDRALDAAAAMVDRDPFGLTTHVAAADLAWQLDARDRAAAWYAAALELSPQKYLDPLAQLTADERQRIQRRLNTARPAD